jgi:superfamily II RNA helicase
MPEMPPATLLAALASYDLLPAIVFLPTRRRCDEATAEAALARREIGAEKAARVEARRTILREFASEHPEVRRHRHWNAIIKGGVAAHHAGHIPAWKLLIERLMSAGLLDAIFATATVAAGVDFPARTVVITNADARTGRGWRQLSASELQQMTGRAGRRGRDNVGFIIVAPGLHQDPERIAALLTAEPDALQSQFRATYTSLLNLLDAYENFHQVRDIVERSFAYRDAAQRLAQLERTRAVSEHQITEKLKAIDCALSIEAARGLERLVSARTRLLEIAPQTRAEARLQWLDEVVVPGRVIGIGRHGRALAFVMRRTGGNLIGMREDGRGINLALERVGRVYRSVYPLKEEAIEEAFIAVRTRTNEPLGEPRLRDARATEDTAVQILNDSIEKLMLHGSREEEERRDCLKALWATFADAEEMERAERSIETLRAEIWQPFERRARVLDHFGYLDFTEERTTARGRWLADLHVDRPLLIGEALQKGIFNALDVGCAAGLVAALAADAERDYGELTLDDALVTTLAEFEKIAYEVATKEWEHGIEPTSEINFSAAATAARWAEKVEWSELVEETRAEEGDLVRMLSRTGDALLQIAGLKKAQLIAADIAARAAETILREPVR